MTESEKISIARLEEKVTTIFNFIENDLRPFMSEMRILKTTATEHEGRIKALEDGKLITSSWWRSISSNVVVIALANLAGWLLYLYVTHSPK
jgi:hypothetical protein